MLLTQEVPGVAPRLPHGRSVRIVPAALRPGSFPRNFDSLLAVKIPRKPKSCTIASCPTRAPRASVHTALAVTVDH